jgi:oligogalacturonide lyase
VAQAPDGEWIELFHPQMVDQGTGALNSTDFFQPGVFHAEHLVNMAHQDYRGEPNPRFSPDKKYVFFTSNMFGRSYVFAAEVAKATDTHDPASTPELATKYNPIMPTPTTTEK